MTSLRTWLNRLFHRQVEVVEPAPGTYYELAVLDRFAKGQPVDEQVVRQQLGVLVAELRKRRR